MMHQIKRIGFLTSSKWSSVLRTSHNGLAELGSAGFSSMATKRSLMGEFSKKVITKSGYSRESALDVCHTTKVVHQRGGNSILPRDQWRTLNALAYHSPFQIVARSGENLGRPYFARCFSAKTTASRQKQSETRKEISTVDDPFDSPTYNIPEKPVTFTEGASYSLVILAGLGIAGAAAYGVFKELIFQPKEYKIFNKALERIQNDGQVRVRIGSPITGYGSESRNRAARQRIPHKTFTDEDGVEHIVVNFHIRGPHGAGKVYSEMFKDKVDNQWKFMYLIVEVTSPSPTQLMLESYVPA